MDHEPHDPTVDLSIEIEEQVTDRRREKKKRPGIAEPGGLSGERGGTAVNMQGTIFSKLSGRDR